MIKRLAILTTFTLDDTRYRLYVMRSDLVSRVFPAD